MYGLSSRRPEFDPGPVRVTFVVDKVTLGQVFLRILWVFPVNIFPKMLISFIHSFSIPEIQHSGYRTFHYITTGIAQNES